MCGANISPLMGKCYTHRLCQNCEEINKMDRDGVLAKNGLMTTDLM
jgi:hypothetical protein